MNNKPTKKVQLLIGCIAFSLCLFLCSGCTPTTKEDNSDRNVSTSTSTTIEDTHKDKTSNNSEKESTPSKNVQQLPSYSKMKSTIDSNIGSYYDISGRVHRVNGGFRGSDYMAYVYYDESETHGEFAVVRIPYKNYKESINSYFSGTCKLEGQDEQGNPLFVCTSQYYAK